MNDPRYGPIPSRRNRRWYSVSTKNCPDFPKQRQRNPLPVYALAFAGTLVILLGDRGTWVCITCPRLLLDSAAVGARTLDLWVISWVVSRMPEPLDYQVTGELDTSIVAAPYARTMTLAAHKSHNWRGDAQQRFLTCKGVKPRPPLSCQPIY